MRTRVILMCLLYSINLTGQTRFVYEHCDCLDVIEQIQPIINGNFERVCSGETIIKGEFVDGLKEGLWLTKSKNGTTIKILSYKNDRLDGPVELFYSSGKKKMTGTFVNGRKEGKWTYYFKTGKTLKTGKFNNGQPVGQWKLYKKNGKKTKVEYDYDNKEYIKENSNKFIFEEAAVVQQDNTHEWFIRSTHSNKSNSESAAMPFEGYDIALELHTILMEIPVEIWETYARFNYRASIHFEDNGVDSIEIRPIKESLENTPELGFFAITNNKEKLHRVEHNTLTLKLLEYNLLETLWLTGPWVTEEENLTIYLPYVINEFKNRSF